MPTWIEILNELNATRSPQGKVLHDNVRRKYLALLERHTGRNTILYATNWTSQIGIPFDQSSITITDEDIQGLMQVIHGLKGDKLDLIIHSPGGSPEATEAFVSYLRMKFKDIRVIIPYAAMSAATMLSCASNVIVMGKHSFIGPIDPQIVLQTQTGVQLVAAQDILDQFGLAKNECQDPTNLNVWYPILSVYGPALLQQCDNALALSKRLVSDWLRLFMFNESHNAETLASSIADYLSNHSNFKTHNRHINRETAVSKGLKIQNLEDDQTFQDLVLSIFHSTTHTFTGTGAIKIIENHLGKAFVKTLIPVQSPPGQPTPLTSDRPKQQ